MPDATSKSQLDSASQMYHEQVDRETADYLTSRGLSKDNARSFLLGVVREPAPGHERYRNRLSIPYITRTGIVTIRFRDLTGFSSAKYLSLPGAEPRLFNPEAFFKPSEFIVICEGEFDTMTLDGMGIPAVGLQGVETWKPFFSKLFKGYSRVLICMDGDEAGERATKELDDKLDNGIPVEMPEGEDVNSLAVTGGKERVMEVLGL